MCGSINDDLELKETLAFDYGGDFSLS
jgi:hypothetical protein